MSLGLDLFACFLMTAFRLWTWAEEPVSDVLSVHQIRRCFVIICSIVWDIYFDYLVKLVFSRVLHCQGTIFSPWQFITSLRCCCCSVAKLCMILCNPMDCSTPGFPVLHNLSCLLSQWCHPTISSSVIHFSFCLQSFSASRSFPMSWLFTAGSQSIETSASTTVLSMNIQGWFPLGWTGLISL